MPTVSLGQPLALGRTAEVYAWPDDHVLKLFHAWCSPEMVQSEVKASRAVAATNLPAPHLIDQVEIDGRLGLIYERVRGQSMLKLINTKPWLLTRLARQLAELHTAIHQQTGAGFLPARLALSATIERGQAIPPELKTGVLRLLEKLPDGDRLCHFDFHPDQVLITPQGPVILDWLTAQQGHPLADVARTALLLKIGQVPYASPAMRVLINLWRGLFYRTYFARYRQLHPGAALADIQTWVIPMAAARLNENIPGEREPLLNLIQAYRF